VHHFVVEDQGFLEMCEGGETGAEVVATEVQEKAGELEVWVGVQEVVCCEY